MCMCLHKLNFCKVNMCNEMKQRCWKARRMPQVSLWAPARIRASGLSSLHIPCLLATPPSISVAGMAVNQREFDDAIRVSLILVDNTSRRSIPHTWLEALRWQLKGDWERRYLTNLVAFGYASLSCRFASWSLFDICLFRRWSLRGLVVFNLAPPSWPYRHGWLYLNRTRDAFVLGITEKRKPSAITKKRSYVFYTGLLQVINSVNSQNRTWCRNYCKICGLLWISVICSQISIV